MSKRDYTHISIVLDRSGSMQSCLNDTIGGFNQFLSAQKQESGEATITMIQFDDEYEVLMDMLPLANAIDLSRENYVPRDCTALLDAIGRTINNVEHKINEKEEDQRPEKVIFVIITDGGENSSREFNHGQVMEMINRHKDENKWEFVFIGANQDAINVGGGMGIRGTSAMSYAQSSVGTQAMYSSLTRNLTSYRRAGLSEVVSEDYAFFSKEDKEEQDELINKDDQENKDDFLKNKKGFLKGIYVDTNNIETTTDSADRDNASK